MFAQTPSAIGSPGDWSQFGLIGLVVFALFVLLFSFGSFMVQRFGKLEDARNKADEQRQAFLEKCLLEHRQERDETRQQMRRDSEENANALKELMNKTLQAIDDNTLAFRDAQSDIRTLLDRSSG